MTTLDVRKKLLCVSLFAALAVFLLPLSQVHAQIPFGGPIVWTSLQNPFQCLTPPGILIILGPPTPGQFMYLTGVSISFAFGPPTHPAQMLLGLAAGFAPCITYPPCPPFGEPCPVPIGGGPAIVYHGSSI